MKCSVNKVSYITLPDYVKRTPLKDDVKDKSRQLGGIPESRFNKL